MERIYQVKLQHAYNFGVYFVRASDVTVAASLVLQADANSPSGKETQKGHHVPHRVLSVEEFCCDEQFVG